MPNVLDELAQRLAGLLSDATAGGVETAEAAGAGEPAGVDDGYGAQGYGEAVDGQFVSGAWRSAGNSPEQPHP